jgi:(2R)-3-sulfolactate dehydrogenase (NADP+)
MTRSHHAPEALTDLAVDILTRHATGPENARAVAAALVAAQIDGHAGHGLSRLPAYAAQAANGKVDGHATPRATRVAG